MVRKIFMDYVVPDIKEGVLFVLPISGKWHPTQDGTIVIPSGRFPSER